MAKSVNQNTNNTDVTKQLKELDEKKKELEQKEQEIQSKEQEVKQIVQEISANEIKLDDKECDKESINTAQKLKEELVQIKIPIDTLNKKEQTVPVIINGYIWEIQRGQEVKVPQEVKRILEEAKYI